LTEAGIRGIDDATFSKDGATGWPKRATPFLLQVECPALDAALAVSPQEKNRYGVRLPCAPDVNSKQTTLEKKESRGDRINFRPLFFY